MVQKIKAKSNKKTLDESIATAMECRDLAIVPFIPYILQDFWELGTPPELVINFIRKHCVAETFREKSLRVLDLGCGKGAVSVRLAAALKCHCFGIDGIPDFIEVSTEKAREYGVDTLCRFEVGDIREKIKELDKFDVIVLGAIGPVFGDYYATLTTLSQHLTPDGIIIINDGYLEDTSTFAYPAVLHHGELLRQIGQAGMELIDEYVGKPENCAAELENIQNRCRELMTKYPEKAALFDDYAQNQLYEYDVLENEVICSIMVFKKKMDDYIISSDSSNIHKHEKQVSTSKQNYHFKHIPL
jgi:2-polyprenyl-3-methyl-5-hydroxy-6-metoxy-1,4-benzoquinol methylase